MRWILTCSVWISSRRSPAGAGSTSTRQRSSAAPCSFCDSKKSWVEAPIPSLNPRLCSQSEKKNVTTLYGEKEEASPASSDLNDNFRESLRGSRAADAKPALNHLDFVAIVPADEVQEILELLVQHRSRRLLDEA